MAADPIIVGRFRDLSQNPMKSSSAMCDHYCAGAGTAGVGVDDGEGLGVGVGGGTSS